MKINIRLNGEEKIIDTEIANNLRDVLRAQNCTSVKCGCNRGACGCCTVLLDGKPVASCKIPIGILHGNEVTTLEKFSAEALYKDITQGFSQTGIVLCGYCNTGKIMLTGNILQKYNDIDVDKKTIEQEISGLAPCCTDKDTLVNGILKAHQISRKRHGANKNGK